MAAEGTNVERFVQLRHGVQMPILGLGTSHGGGYNQEAVIFALKECNYRLIDTARRYGCEEYIGHAIRESGIPRHDVFLATKMWPTDYGLETGVQACHTALKKLDTNYLDLYMLHWPVCPSWAADPKALLEEAWRSLEILFDEGLCRSIGVSNFQIDDLQHIMDVAGVVPHVNQCEFHPYQNPKELRAFCQQNGINFQGYCPLANGQIFNEAPIQQVSKEVGRSPAQVLIRWSIQNGVVTIPKSTKKERVRENCQVFDFQLSESQIDQLNNIDANIRVVDPNEMQMKIDDHKPDGYKLLNNVCLQNK